MRQRYGGCIACIDGEKATIRLTRGQLATIDTRDVDAVTPYVWQVLWKKGKPRYARATVNGSEVYLHNHILGDILVDHKDGDGLNNSRENLRKCTGSQNSQNMKPRNRALPKGVQYRKHAEPNPYAARIMINYEGIFLGYHHTPREAQIAYATAAYAIFGEFARIF